MKNIYRSIACSIVIILSLLMLLAGVSCKSNESPTPIKEKTKSFIWKISSETTSVYLLGSVHVASKDLYPLDSAIENAFTSAKYLVVEVNTNNISQDEAMQLLVDYGLYAEGEMLSKHLPADLYNKLQEQLQKFGINMALLDGYRPFVAYNMMSQLLLESLGYKFAYGIDLYFMDKADKSGKNILDLETAEYQMSLISSIPDEIMIDMIQYDIDNPELEKYLQELFTAWEDGDVAEMEIITFEALVQQPELEPYYEMMYDQRNLKMLEKIEEFLADDEIYFVVVGAGHLVGENGLINLLKNKGYKVEQLYDSD
ncbi:MAG: hypothetical protein A2Z15_03040 [Chloroflexi bacterium RBG_16_50_11]|nr:MAG: hypothetical protein A2Z15_03040 [Chloroflexi bacterium RBG_16_50_11]